jgi:hypothetical protein
MSMPSNKPFTPHRLFDTLIAERRLKNDAALCRELGVKPPHLSKMRAGVLPVSDSVRVAILRNLCGWSIKRLDKLAPPEVAAEQEEAAH